MSWRARLSVSIVTAGLLVAGGTGLGVYGQQTKGAGKAEGKAEEHHEYPHIHAAIRELHEAKKELERAAHDFGGHRVEALKASDHAIQQLERALKFARKH